MCRDCELKAAQLKLEPGQSCHPFAIVILSEADYDKAVICFAQDLWFVLSHISRRMGPLC